MEICIDFKYDDNDIISDTIITFYNSYSNKDEIKDIINLYINDSCFFQFVQKNFLVKNMSASYLRRLYNDYDSNDIVDELDIITSVNTTRWI